jgi:hypothetical protein
MKILKKIIGFIIVAMFLLFVIGCFIYDIMTTGWCFIISTLFMLVVVALFLFVLYLLTDNE